MAVEVEAVAEEEDAVDVAEEGGEADEVDTLEEIEVTGRKDDDWFDSSSCWWASWQVTTGAWLLRGKDLTTTYQQRIKVLSRYHLM